MPVHCGRCGNEITDDAMAMVGDDHYCHDGLSPTCYELASWAGLSRRSYLRGVRSINLWGFR